MEVGSWYNTFVLVMYVMNQVLAVVFSVMLILKKEDPVKTLTWVLAMLLLPYVGLIFYVFLGRNFRKKKMFDRKGAADIKVRKNIANGMINALENGDLTLPEKLRPFSKLIFQNLRSSSSILTRNSKYEIYFNGRDALNSMIKAIEGAKKHIHVQSYIIENDEMGNRFKDLLIKKANEGLEVRLIYDGLGSKSLPKAYREELAAAGVEVLVFSPFRWFFPPLIVNYRNHRKILIVDGKIGFIGGVNIASRYCDGGSSFKEWRDTHMMLEGESVFSLQASFLLDRYFIINKNIRKRKSYYPVINFYNDVGKIYDNAVYSQILTSGPDSDWASIMQCYFTAITQAKHHVYIITPYFIPQESLLMAIKTAALSNVKISIMIPERSDTWLANWGTMSYISELLDARVNIYLFKRGFNHSKVMCIDSEFAIIGSANFDNRSMEQNFEAMAVMYDKGVTEIVENKFEEDLQRCTLVTRAKWNKRPVRNRICESVARLVSPML